jgi:hypothetical protein
MMRALLALLLCFSLATPQGWASVAMVLCGTESAIHVGDHGDCCKKPCHDADEDPTCCSEFGDSDDRASASDTPAPDLAFAVLPPEPAWPPRREDATARASSWLLGPPAVGPPHWLRLRTLRL